MGHRQASANRRGGGLRARWSAVRRGAALATGLLGLLVAASRFRPTGDRARWLAAPILVLFPYEGKFDPNVRPRTRSFDWRISTGSLAWRKQRIVAPRSCVRAVSAVHHVRRKTGREVVVETELVLVASGQSPWVWRLPVSGARDIETTLDGRKTRSAIAPGGQVGRGRDSAGGKSCSVGSAIIRDQERGGVRGARFSGEPDCGRLALWWIGRRRAKGRRCSRRPAGRSFKPTGL